ncbi:MAG TPA: PIN domain-containing protein [Candidatus Acidoferrales bacterium]|nr:PIN domain-containing protein [Candidatus Acidoferrales bacterium]
MSRIFWDTNLYIYLLENYGPLSKRTIAIRKAMLSRGDELLTSTLTLGEALVKPREQGQAELAKRYEEAIRRTSTLIPFEEKAALVYSTLRRDRSLRVADAIQLSCAAAAGVDLFLTNDLRLAGKQVSGIQFIVPLDRAPM